MNIEQVQSMSFFLSHNITLILVHAGIDYRKSKMIVGNEEVVLDIW